MSRQTWIETLVTQQAAGTLFASFTTAKTVIDAQALFTLPAGYWEIGRKISVDVMGAISNIVTTPGLVALQVLHGSIIVFTTGNMQMSTTAHTTLPFHFHVELTCRAVGSGTSANLMGQSVMQSQTVAATAVADSTESHTVLMGPNTAPAVGTGFDSTISNIIDFHAGFTISNAGNGIQIHQYDVKALN